MTNVQHRFSLTIAAVLSAVLLLPSTTAAQLNGTNLKGDAGLKSGSQPPPGAYVAIPLWMYSADQIKDRDGNELLTGSLDATILGAALSVVTTRQVAGGNYGFLVVVPWANNRVQGAEDFDSNPGSGLTDMYIQPINAQNPVGTSRARTSSPPTA